MGLLNYDEQKSVIQESDAVIEFLESYAQTMNLYIIELGSLWEKNADQNYILRAMGNCVDIAADIAYDYSTFSVNAINWLNQFDALEKIVKSIIPGKKVRIKSVYDTQSVSFQKIKLKSTDLEDYVRKIQAFNQKFDSAKVKTLGLNSRVDKLIMQRFSDFRQYSLQHINNRIGRLQLINSDIYFALMRIAKIYADRENELNNVGSLIIMNGDTSGVVNTSVMKTYVEQQRNAPVTAWPVAKEYSIELGSVANMDDPEEIRKYIEDRNSGLQTQGANLQHRCTRHTAEKLATIGVNVTSYGNGNTWYQNLKNKKWSSNEEVRADAYDGDTFWDKISNGNIKQPIYNIVISYGKAGDPWGHVLMIDAIVDGKVCYSDNYDSTGRNGGRRGSAQVVTIDEFRKLYSRQRYVQQGAIHFTS